MCDFGEPQHPLERLDDLVIEGMKMWQRTDEFRFSQDAVLLAHFVSINKHRKYAELGSGTGAIPLLLSALGATSVTGFEKNEVVANLAKRNVELNRKADKVQIFNEDYLALPSSWNGVFDTVVANPPYFRGGTGAVSTHSGIALALHEGETTLPKVVHAAAKLLRQGGSLCMIYHVSQWMYLEESLVAANFTVKRVRFVHSFLNKPAKMVLIEATLKGNPGLIVEAPLAIYKMDSKEYTDEIKGWYGRER